MDNHYKRDNSEFHNAYVCLETYLHELTGLPNYVGVMGLFQRTLSREFRYQLKQIREFRNSLDGHGIRIGGEEPIAPDSWIKFLKDEIAWIEKNEAEVKERILKVYAEPRPQQPFVQQPQQPFVQQPQQPQQPYVQQPYQPIPINPQPIIPAQPTKPEKPVKVKKPKEPTTAKPLSENGQIIISAIILALLACVSAVVLWVCNAGFEQIFIKTLITLGAIVIFTAVIFVVNWFNKKDIISNYKLGTFLTAFALILNVTLTFILKSNYDFISLWVFISTLLVGALSSKAAFEDENEVWAAVNVLESLAALLGLIFVIIYLINGWNLNWNTIQWIIGLGSSIILGIIAFAVPALTTSLFDNYTGEIILGVVIIANFVLSLIFKDFYQYVFYILSTFAIINGVALFIANSQNSFMAEENRVIDVIEIIITVIFVVIYIFVH